MIYRFIRIALSLFVLYPNICSGRNLPKPLVLDQMENCVCLENHGLYLTHTDTLQDITDILSSGDFKTFDQVDFNSDTQTIWILFSVKSKVPNDSIFINSKFYDEVKLYEVNDQNRPILISSTGYLPQYHPKNAKKWNANISFYHAGFEQKLYLLGLISHTRNSRALSSYFTSNCAKIYPSSGFDQDYTIPKFLLYFFLGGILMMSCYNLGIAIATQYKEYILFSIYNLCFVLMGFMLSNQHIDLGWVTPFDFERNLRFVPAVLGVPVYLLFSIFFLEIKKLNEYLYQFLVGAIWVFISLVMGLLGSLYNLVFIFYIALTPLLLLSVLYASWIRARQHVYALYFLFGNALLGIVGFSQILSLYGWMSNSNAAVLCILALMLEIICFSFAVAIKQKVTRKELYLMRVKNQLQRERIEYELDLKRKLEIEIEKKSRTLSSSSIQWLNLNEQLDKLKKKMKDELMPLDEKLYKKLIRRIEEIEHFEDHWNTFKLHFENVHRGFFERIEKNFPMLSQNDLKLCAFMKMKLSNKEIAQILNITKKAVEQSKRRMRKKIGLESEQDILEYIEHNIHPLTDDYHGLIDSAS